MKVFYLVIYAITRREAEGKTGSKQNKLKIMAQRIVILKVYLYASNLSPSASLSCLLCRTGCVPHMCRDQHLISWHWIFADFHYLEQSFWKKGKEKNCKYTTAEQSFVKFFMSSRFAN